MTAADQFAEDRAANLAGGGKNDDFHIQCPLRMGTSVG
jgi:hypothetical protein